MGAGGEGTPQGAAVQWGCGVVYLLPPSRNNTWEKTPMVNTTPNDNWHLLSLRADYSCGVSSVFFGTVDPLP